MIQPTHFIGEKEFVIIGADAFGENNTVCRRTNELGCPLWVVKTIDLRPVAEKHKAGCKVWVFPSPDKKVVLEQFFISRLDDSIHATSQLPSTWPPSAVFVSSYNDFTFTEPKAGV